MNQTQQVMQKKNLLDLLDRGYNCDFNKIKINKTNSYEHEKKKFDEEKSKSFENGVIEGREAEISIKQEQVRKLKFEILDTYHKLGRANVWAVSNDCVCDLCEDYFRKKIDEIFPDCAEQSKWYVSCDAPIGEFCKKHGVTHTKYEVKQPKTV